MSFHLANYQTLPLAIVLPTTKDMHDLEIQINYFSPDKRVFLFKSWDTLPFDQAPPTAELICQRHECLFHLLQNTYDIVLFDIPSILQKTYPKNYIAQNVLSLKQGDILPLTTFKAFLSEHGYLNIQEPQEKNEFCINGNTVILWHPALDHPIIIEWFDDEIEAIYHAHDHTPHPMINIYPASSVPLSTDHTKHFLKKWPHTYQDKHVMYQAIKHQQYVGGLEYFLPLFFEQIISPLEYLQETPILCPKDLESLIQNHLEYVKSRHEDCMFNRYRTPLSIDTLYTRPPLSIPNQQDYHCDFSPPEVIDVESYTSKKNKYHLHSPSMGQLIQNAQKWNLPEHVSTSWKDQSSKLFLSPLTHCIEKKHIPLSCIQIIEQPKDTTTTQATQYDAWYLNETFKIHDFIIHESYGIGQYEGLQLLKTGTKEHELIKIKYADEQVVYLPIEDAGKLKFIAQHHGPLDSLKNKRWHSHKSKAKQAAHDIAQKLLHTYAQRQAQHGHAFKIDQEDYYTFSKQFPYTLTTDQAKACDEVLHDMVQSSNMDRLICGDVGFGKTEVAMRAAFICISNDRQCIVLVPTTLLANQHLASFQERFHSWPFNIALLTSRMTLKARTQRIKQYQDKRIDLLITTHTILHQHDIFSETGLLIIDEEHRFGVEQKQKIQAICEKQSLDILSMTATPIPRTLNLALCGIKTISMITTPPPLRLPVITMIRPYSKHIIQEGISRELHRGGQLFYLCHRINQLEYSCKRLKSWFPEYKINFIHGQMKKKEIDDVMQAFIEHRIHILVCTTIIESGIDIPNVNTIIIERADCLGLAQLHQIRGRVGRASKQAFAYLLTPEDKILTNKTKSRLGAIAHFHQQGAGFQLANQDLELRGAGELLGAKQSGHLEHVGYHYFITLLNDEIKHIQNHETPTIPTIIEWDIPHHIPHAYIQDMDQRMHVYRSLSLIQSLDTLNTYIGTLVDQYGNMPDEASACIDAHRLRLLGGRLHITTLKIVNNTITIDFASEKAIDHQKIQKALYKQTLKMVGPMTITSTLKSIDYTHIKAWLHTLIHDHDFNELT